MKPREDRVPVHHDDSWGPLPPRPAFSLLIRFVLTVLLLPLWWALLVVLFLCFIAFALVAEIFTIIPGFEKGFLSLIDKFGDNVAVWPVWCVTLPELRHEGDAAFYRARVDQRIASWTSKELAAQKAKKAPPPGPHDIPVRAYRGVGAGYVVEAARAQGWELSHDHPSDPLHMVRLRRLPVAA
ncbi:membrane protein [Streptomyces malaysiensis subsp. malaysiensis]|nr:membrane protein [Streptomyces malaysiensis]